MKYIVIGMGYFGSKLATVLTAQGHEVIGVDLRSDRLDELKDQLATVMKMDCTNINAVKKLPLGDSDAVIVAIGEDVGASILALSILKKLNVDRIIGRAINQIHQNILVQIGIDEIVMPLEDSAHSVASMLQLKNVLRLTDLNNDYAVAEISVQHKYTGHLIDTINIRERFRLKAVAVKRAPKESFVGTIFRRNFSVDLIFSDDVVLKEKDILVVAGTISDIKKFAESQ